MSSTESPSDGNRRGRSNSSDHLPAHKPRARHRSYWLHDYEQISLQESLDMPEAETTSTVNSIYKVERFNRENRCIEEYYGKAKPEADGSACFNQQNNVDDGFPKLEQPSDIKDLNAIISDDLQKMEVNQNFLESCVADTCSMDLDSRVSQVSQPSKKLGSDLDSCWFGIENTEPWWRTNDRGDLASVLISESCKHIKSGDIPCPEDSGRMSSCLLNFNQINGQVMTGVPADADTVSRDLASASVEKASSAPSVIGHPPHGSESLSSETGPSAETPSSGQPQQGNPDPSRVQLLEALCHSQTRAREAEKLAQKAYDEKEKIIDLYFRQASHLFAYKQWVEILRLEALCLQLKNKGAYISSQLKKSARRPKKRKPGKARTKRSKSFVAFAFGLGLAGAGLLLGWTIGWLFPTF